MFQVCRLLSYRLVTFKFCQHNLCELIASAMPVVYNNTFGSNIHIKQPHANVACNTVHFVYTVSHRFAPNKVCIQYARSGLSAA